MDSTPDYDSQRREEVMPYVPTSATTVLDVGCAGGAFGRALQEARPGVLVDGIEADPTSAQLAAGAYRRVITGVCPEDLPSERYDAIVCNDVLEHMIDPWTAVADLRHHLRPGGCVIASIPNMRHWSALGPLLRGRWDYRSHGVLDRTHLRWFTKATMAELFEDAGYKVRLVEKLTGSPPKGAWRAARVVRRSLVDDLFTKQYVVVAVA